MTTKVFTYIYFIVLMTGIMAGIRNWRCLSQACRWICVVLILTFLSENFAGYVNKVRGNNLFVYHLFNPIEFFLIAMFFNESIPAFKKKNIGVWIGMFGVLFTLINTGFFQPLDSFSTNFLLFESFAVIGLSVYSLYRMYKYEEEVVNNPHFWIASILLFYWSLTFFHFGLYSYYLSVLQPYLKPFHYAFFSVNIIAYAAIAVVFIRYPKIVAAHE